MEEYFSLKLDNGSLLDVSAPAGSGIKPHDICVFRRDYYLDMGEAVCRLESAPPPLPNNAELPQFQRMAQESDFSAAAANEAKLRPALTTARQLIDQLQLEMKLLNAHYTLDGKLVVIQFSADGRVDFRELVKELSRALSCRIELRQIGVRDETGLFGGIGICGQPLCCARFLKEFNSINVKMAKEQDLSLTPSTISGACGRLKCCLKYEYDGYAELGKGMPKRGDWCDTPQGHGRITDRNLLTQKLSVQLDDGPLVQFDRNEVTVGKSSERFRSKNDDESHLKAGEKREFRPRNGLRSPTAGPNENKVNPDKDK